jgi:D-serine deaminase-like pyridoxal phosphate-dependent protein
MDPKGRSKWELDTPCLTIDLDLLDENLQKMQARVAAAGKALRPHAKTHKCAMLAKMQLAAGAIGICAAKVSEAEALVAAGIEGVLITGPIATSAKAARLKPLLRKSRSVMAVVDHPSGVELLEKLLAGSGLRLDVLVDVDVGHHRTGVAPARAMDLVQRVMACRNLWLRGIQAYAGHVQHIPRYVDRRAASLKALKQAAAVFRQLQNRDEGCTIFSASGTGTATTDLAVPELTELQAGSYALMDAEYMAIECEDGAECSDYSPALTLLTTVVSTGHRRQQVTVDAGLKALYRDGGRPRVLNPDFPKLQYDWFGDEYGKLSAAGRGALLPELGTVLELVVSHCDPTVNQFDRFYITRGGKVVDVWPIDLRGRCQ